MLPPRYPARVRDHLREATGAALSRAEGWYDDPLPAVVDAVCGVVAGARALPHPRPYDDRLAALLAPWAEPGAGERLGAVYEDLLAARRERRRSAGAFYTPPALVGWVLDRALDPMPDGGPVPAPTLLDPACGTGHFLVAAARRLGGTSGVHGSDTDEVAVQICRFLLALADPGADPAAIAARVRVADGLTAWTGQRFDAVVGNPPFLGQLRRRTAGETGGLGAYTDTSAVFLHRALDLADEGGAVALVQPLSLLGARDAGRVRAAVRERGALTGLWAADRPVFAGAAVLACAPVVRIGASQADVATWHGSGLERGPDLPMPEGEWGPLAAPAFGVPAVRLAADHGSLGDLAACTADFRDQYYGLVPHVREATAAEPGAAPLVTSGLIEPAACEWGRRPTRFARQRYDAPVVDLAGLRAAGKLAGWAEARLVPKLLVAGQGRVIEAVADERGNWLPSVPVVSVVPHDPSDLWRLLAVLLAPPVVAHAAARFLGSGLSPTSVKVSARQLAALPLPADRAAWAEGAALARRAQAAGGSAERTRLLAECGVAMTRAYAAPAAALDWWRERVERPAARPGSRSAGRGAERAGEG